MYLMSLNMIRIGSRFKVAPFVDFFKAPVRSLFTKEELGVTQFEQIRQSARKQFGSAEEIENHKEKFIETFSVQPLDEKRNNLKEYLLLIDGKPDELKTLKSVLMEYQDVYNNSVHHVKEFVFGTQIMRLFYLLNLPDEAVKFYKDADLKNMFDQMQTYKVMLTLLYENKRYGEVFELYSQIRKRLDLYELFPDITLNCLAFAVCYHLNTPEHFEYAQDLWLRTKNSKQLNRSRYFLAGLAIKQNKPDIALNLVNKNNLYVTVRFIQLNAFTQIGNFDRACDILRRTIESHKLNCGANKPKFGQQMVGDLRDAIRRSGTQAQMEEFNKIYDNLKLLDLLSNETLDERLCATFPPMLPKNLFLKMKQKTARIN